eukprot:810568-Rhodomonas_salina.3
MEAVVGPSPSALLCCSVLPITAQLCWTLPPAASSPCCDCRQRPHFVPPFRVCCLFECCCCCSQSATRLPYLRNSDKTVIRRFRPKLKISLPLLVVPETLLDASVPRVLSLRSAKGETIRG